MFQIFTGRKVSERLKETSKGNNMNHKMNISWKIWTKEIDHKTQALLINYIIYIHKSELN